LTVSRISCFISRLIVFKSFIITSASIIIIIIIIIIIVIIIIMGIIIIIIIIIIMSIPVLFDLVEQRLQRLRNQVALGRGQMTTPTLAS
jgi:Zn-dependent membrane protease YugP